MKQCNHQHRASNGWADVTNSTMDYSSYESHESQPRVTAYNEGLRREAEARASRQDYCLDCGQKLGAAEPQAAVPVIREDKSINHWTLSPKGSEAVQ